MTTHTTGITREKLLDQAREAEQEERALLDQLNSIPARVAEAKEAARQRYSVMYMEKVAGRSTDEPYYDWSEAEAIAGTEEELKTSAKQAGIRRFKLFAAYWRDVERERREVLEALSEPLRDLEEQEQRIKNDLQAIRAAQSSADRRRSEAYREALSYERAAAHHEQQDHPIRRL